MSGFEFAAALVGSLAWPVVVLIVAVLFRRHLSVLLARPLSSSKAGPLEAVWDRQVAEVEAELPRSPSCATSGGGAADTDRLREIACAAPAAAVLEAFALIEEQLRQILLDAGVYAGRGGAMQMARRALEAGLVRPEAGNSMLPITLWRSTSRSLKPTPRRSPSRTWTKKAAWTTGTDSPSRCRSRVGCVTPEPARMGMGYR